MLSVIVIFYSSIVCLAECNMESANYTLEQPPPPELGIVNITEENYQMFLYSGVDKILITVFMPIIFTIGVLGNIAVIIVFFRIKGMRTVTNHYLTNLAIADMIFLLLAVTDRWVLYVSSKIVNDYSYTSRAFCKTFPYIQDVSIIVSCYTVILVTVERYIAICWPHKFKQLSTRPRALMLCSFFWMFALLYKIPDLFFIDNKQERLRWPEGEEFEQYSTTRTICTYCIDKHEQSCNRFRKSLALDQIMLLMVIPITMVLYTLIVLQLQKLNSNNIRSTSSTKMKKQVVRMLIVTITVYVICITPFRILNLCDILGLTIPPTYIWAIVNIGRIMTYTNSAINPIIYNIMSDRYRFAFRETFFFCFAGYTPVNVEMSSKSRNTRIYTDKTTVNGR